MKYFSRLNTYKASNVEFNPETQEATSYNWWCFFKVINGKNVFNVYAYSNTTRRHQLKVIKLLGDLSIKIDYLIETPESLNSSKWKQEALNCNAYKIEKLIKEIKKKRSKKEKNKERREGIKTLLKDRAKIWSL